MIINNNYMIACTELYEIIRNLPKNEKDRIPNEFIKNLELNIDINYVFKYDSNVSIDQQKIHKETKALLVQLYILYFSEESEKELWKKYDNECLKRINKKKLELYDPNKIFAPQNNVNEIIFKHKDDRNDKLIKYKESVIKKILNRLRERLKF